MKFIDIVIATRNRYVKLARTIESIPDVDYIGIQIVVDGEMDTIDRINKDWRVWRDYLHRIDRPPHPRQGYNGHHL